MIAFLDTNFLVRFLTGEPSQFAKISAEVLESEQPLVIPDTALVEAVHVMDSVYQLQREIIADHFIRLLQKENISIFGLNKGFVVQGLMMCRPSGRVSFADALIWAAARSAGADVIYSFDERFPSEGIELKKSL